MKYIQVTAEELGSFVLIFSFLTFVWASEMAHSFAALLPVTLWGR